MQILSKCPKLKLKPFFSPERIVQCKILSIQFVELSAFNKIYYLGTCLLAGHSKATSENLREKLNEAPKKSVNFPRAWSDFHSLPPSKQVLLCKFTHHRVRFFFQEKILVSPPVSPTKKIFPKIYERWRGPHAFNRPVYPRMCKNLSIYLEHHWKMAKDLICG